MTSSSLTLLLLVLLLIGQGYSQINLDNVNNGNIANNGNNGKNVKNESNGNNGNSGNSGGLPPTASVVAYQNWLRKYSSSYDITDTVARGLIFNKNLEKILAHNSNPNSAKYKLGVNQFTGLTQQEFENYVLGERPKRGNSDNNKEKKTTSNLQSENVAVINEVQTSGRTGGAQGVTSGSGGGSSSTPSNNGTIQRAWDWRGALGALTSVKDQGLCGSCYAFATVGVVESQYLIVKGVDSDLSEQQVVDCSSDYIGNYGCQGGWRDYAMMYIQAYGLVQEATLPYTATKNACNTGNGAFQISQWSIVYGCDNFRDAVRRGPISVGVAASSWGPYASGIYECNQSDWIVNHSVMLVGYTEDGHWIIKNCWGPGWGEDGYITINKDTNDCRICEREAIGAIVSP